jgi:hypothetical protein
MPSHALSLGVAAIGFAAVLVSSPASADPIELSCKIGDKPHAVFLIDMEKAAGRWVNANEVYDGKLDIQETYILLKIDKHGIQFGTRLRVNRYTGEALMEVGDAPFALDTWPTGTGNPGNTFEVGSCVAGPEKRLF